MAPQDDANGRQHESSAEVSATGDAQSVGASRVRPITGARRVELLEDHAVARDAPRRVVDWMVDALVAQGVDAVYAVPGDAIAPLYTALDDHPAVRVTNAAHESAAVFMAMGYARASGRVPCVLVASDAGVTNALTGLAAAAADGVALIAIGGDVSRPKDAGDEAAHALDALAMVRGVTKLATEITAPRAAPHAIRKAVAAARAGREGPVFLALPRAVATLRVLPSPAPAPVMASVALDAPWLARAAALLQDAERPLLFVGSGGRHPEAMAEVQQLAEALQIPVMTTPAAKGLFPETDALSLGVYGHGGHPSARAHVARRPDVLLCVGGPLGETHADALGALLRATTTRIQVDLDVAQISRGDDVQIALGAPPHEVLRAVTARVARSAWRRRAAGGVTYDEPDSIYDDSLPLRPARVLHRLQEVMPGETIYTSDAGEHLPFALHYLRAQSPNGFIATTGRGAPGAAVGVAIGAKLARPATPVVALCSARGFQLSAMELATCVQHRIGVVVVVLNNARTRRRESGNARVSGRTAALDAPRVDFAALARAVGAQGHAVRCAEDFDALSARALCGDLPTVLDVEIDPDAALAESGCAPEVGNLFSTWPARPGDHD